MADPAGRPSTGRLALLVAALVTALALAACGSSSTASPAASAPVGINGTWLLTDYVTPSGTSFTVPGAVTPTLVIAGDAASGNAGCNSFNAIVTLDDPEPGAIRFSQASSTKMACQDPMATVEAAYLQALNLVILYEVDGDKLVLNGPGGENPKPQLVFIRGTSS